VPRFYSSQTERGSHHLASLSRFRLFALSLCLFGLIVGARWALFNRYGTDVPQWDQWDAEGLFMFYPLSIGQFHYLAGFWRAHNEHHVALTRIVAWALAELNGQWDQRLEATVNALLPATIALVFLLLAARRLSERWTIGLFVLLAALFALPVASQNTLSGFDSQQFFLIGLAIGAVATLPFSEPFHRDWWAGTVCVLLSLGSMGSGFFAGGVVGGMLTFQVWRGERPLRSAAPGLVVCATAIAIGVMSRAVNAGHEAMKAQSLTDFFMTTVRALGWPAFDFNWGFSSLILFVPWALVTLRLLDPRRRTPHRWNQFLSGTGLWVFCQVLATAYARGSGGPSPASRYIDTLAIGLIVNLLCLHALGQTEGWPKPRRDLAAILGGAWGFLCALGVAGSSLNAFTGDLPPMVSYNYYCEQNVRNYLITQDESYLRHDEIPYPWEPGLKQDLDYPGIAHILPVSVRVPIAIFPAAIPSSGVAEFIREDSRVSESLNRLPRRGAGIPASTPVLANAVTWGSFGSKNHARAARWRSEPIQAVSGRWLKFEVAGDLGDSGLALELQNPTSGRVLATVRPDKKPGDTWRSAYVHVPPGAFVIAARDESPSGWMAFSEPIEMGAGSYWAWQAVRHGELIAELAGFASLGVFLLGFQSLRRTTDHP